MERLIINVCENEIQTAYVVDDCLVEYLIDKTDKPSIVGNIYSGIVKNITSQCAFVDIGLDKNAFLSINDNKEKHLFENGKLLLKNSNSVVVQVLKDPYNEKGAVVTTNLSFSSENMVININSTNEVCISQKIVKKTDRVTIKKVAYSFSDVLKENGLGLIMRTNSVLKTEEELREEFLNLVVDFKKFMETKDFYKPPALISKKNNYVYEQFLKYPIDEIICNDANILSNINKDCIKTHYNEETQIFSKYALKNQIEKINNKKVWLKCGGYIVIEKTEACVVVDVNTGKIVSNKNDEEIYFKVNKEASIEIAKQIRLRNLSGAIIVDFINMKTLTFNNALLETFRQAVFNDRIKVEVLGITFLGMVMLTRKKEMS